MMSTVRLTPYSRILLGAFQTQLVLWQTDARVQIINEGAHITSLYLVECVVTSGRGDIQSST